MFVNYDEVNRVRKAAGEKVGYRCNCCGELVSVNEFVARDDGSRVICGKCITGLAKLLHGEPEIIIYAVVEDDDGYQVGAGYGAEQR